MILAIMLPQVHVTCVDAVEKKAKNIHEAIELMDNGDYKKSLSLLEEAKSLDPGNVDYPYEMAYAYYAKGDYKKAASILEGLKSHEDATDLFFQLLGNSYDMMGKADKAIDAYDQGLKKFPKSIKITRCKD